MASQYRYEWYQNDRNVYLNIFIKTSADKVKVEFKPQSLSANIDLPSGGSYVLDLEPLTGAIEPAESNFEVLSTKVEITLRKAVVGIQWAKLEGELANPAPRSQSAEATANPPQYPSSSRKQPVNWDKLARETEKDPEEASATGDQAVNQLFQSLYKDASEETRRAMMKSFVESQGTCLSTDWSEVSKGKVDVKAPDGMVPKKY
ncbi:Cochaperone protein [Dimargaris cristalligena]|uniref:SGS domain-containing protein n=1 Tax=Dimargaris cristalligena TaxID=215637 RepID=A0A4P9ZPU9_9FUNG|nr:Cochaperone protein [Dimargaris cristalligena]RKP35476.1 SGS domain-containing protein [Dimargaris cristalligena]|eukprot:RKP35476.1 SGS domain-containing protein [Dimargaris cristalligena]